MRSLRFALAAACMIATSAFASPTDPKNGAEYLTLSAPQPTQVVGKKVEVIEFFMYHCPACNALEPHLESWVKKQGDNILFKRVHLPYTGDNDPEAHLHLTLEAMGKSEEWSPKVFRAVHIERVRLAKDDQIIEWVAKNGMDKAKFLEYWNSFGVLTKLKRAPQILKNYRIDGVPTLVVDGRFVTSPSAVGQANSNLGQGQVYGSTMQVLDALVAQVAKEKGATAPAAKPAK
jgi:thiol:disulfide interchange protein DsbA